MNPMTNDYAHVDEDGHLNILGELAHDLGFVPGARVKLDRLADRLILHRSVSQLARV